MCRTQVRIIVPIDTRGTQDVMIYILCSTDGSAVIGGSTLDIGRLEWPFAKNPGIAYAIEGTAARSDEIVGRHPAV
jgi:hypothetical protein